MQTSFQAPQVHKTQWMGNTLIPTRWRWVRSRSCWRA